MPDLQAQVIGFLFKTEGLKGMSSDLRSASAVYDRLAASMENARKSFDKSAQSIGTTTLKAEAALHRRAEATEILSTDVKTLTKSVDKQSTAQKRMQSTTKKLDKELARQHLAILLVRSDTESLAAAMNATARPAARAMQRDSEKLHEEFERGREEAVEPYTESVDDATESMRSAEKQAGLLQRAVGSLRKHWDKLAQATLIGGSVLAGMDYQKTKMDIRRTISDHDRLSGAIDRNVQFITSRTGQSAETAGQWLEHLKSTAMTASDVYGQAGRDVIDFGYDFQKVAKVTMESALTFGTVMREEWGLTEKQMGKLGLTLKETQALATSLDLDKVIERNISLTRRWAAITGASGEQQAKVFKDLAFSASQFSQAFVNPEEVSNLFERITTDRTAMGHFTFLLHKAAGESQQVSDILRDMGARDPGDIEGMLRRGENISGLMKAFAASLSTVNPELIRHSEAYQKVLGPMGWTEEAMAAMISHGPGMVKTWGEQQARTEKHAKSLAELADSYNTLGEQLSRIKQAGLGWLKVLGAPVIWVATKAFHGMANVLGGIMDLFQRFPVAFKTAFGAAALAGIVFFKPLVWYIKYKLMGAVMSFTKKWVVNWAKNNKTVQRVVATTRRVVASLRAARTTVIGLAADVKRLAMSFEGMGASATRGARRVQTGARRAYDRARGRGRSYGYGARRDRDRPRRAGEGVSRWGRDAKDLGTVEDRRRDVRPSRRRGLLDRLRGRGRGRGRGRRGIGRKLLGRMSGRGRGLLGLGMGALSIYEISQLAGGGLDEEGGAGSLMGLGVGGSILGMMAMNKLQDMQYDPAGSAMDTAADVQDAKTAGRGGKSLWRKIFKKKPGGVGKAGRAARFLGKGKKIGKAMRFLTKLRGPLAGKPAVGGMMAPVAVGVAGGLVAKKIIEESANLIDEKALGALAEERRMATGQLALPKLKKLADNLDTSVGDLYKAFNMDATQSGELLIKLQQIAKRKPEGRIASALKEYRKDLGKERVSKAEQAMLAESRKQTESLQDILDELGVTEVLPGHTFQGMENVFRRQRGEREVATTRGALVGPPEPTPTAAAAKLSVPTLATATMPAMPTAPGAKPAGARYGGGVNVPVPALPGGDGALPMVRKSESVDLSRMKDETVLGLHALNAKMQEEGMKPLRITSGSEPWEGHRDSSYHYRGEAADVTLMNRGPASRLFRLAQELGWGGDSYLNRKVRSRGRVLNYAHLAKYGGADLLPKYATVAFPKVATPAKTAGGGGGGGAGVTTTTTAGAAGGVPGLGGAPGATPEVNVNVTADNQEVVSVLTKIFDEILRTTGLLKKKPPQSVSVRTPPSEGAINTHKEFN